MGAAGGGDDVLAAVEKLTEVTHFEVLQLLGQGCNGAVFKVGIFSFPPRFVFHTCRRETERQREERAERAERQRDRETERQRDTKQPG